MKPELTPSRAPVRDTRLLRGGHWFLLVLWGLSWAGSLLFWTDGPNWASRAGQSGLVAFFGLVAWWAFRGFVGYEHRVGVRILRRKGPKPRTWMLVFCAVVLGGVGVGAMALGVRSASVAVVVASASLAAIVLVVARYFKMSATLSIIGIAIGVAALIVVQSVATGFQHEFERRVLGVYAHINVTRSYGISEYRRFEEYLRTVDGVQGASPFVYYAMALAPEGQRGEQSRHFRRASVLVKGIEPETADEVIDLAAHLNKGAEDAGTTAVDISELTHDVALQPMPDRDESRLPEVIAATPDPRGEDWYPKSMQAWRALPDAQKYGLGQSMLIDDDEWPDEVQTRVVAASDDLPTMFVGITLAKELDLDVDSVVTLVDPGASFDVTEAPEFRRYRIAGVFRAGFQEYDSRLVYIHIRELQYFKYRGKDLVSGVDLRLKDPYDAPAVEAVLRDTIGDVEYSILEWQKLNANLFQSIRTQKSILTIILGLVSAVAGFNVITALWTMVERRKSDIAILMALGATESGCGRIFQFAGVTLGAVGSVAGLAFGLVLCWLVQLYGYTLDPEVYFIERLPVELSLEQISAVLGVTMGISFLATIAPSLRAAKLRPVEGLRYE